MQAHTSLLLMDVTLMVTRSNRHRIRLINPVPVIALVPAPTSLVKVLTMVSASMARRQIPQVEGT